MLQSLVVTFREGLEAFLIIGIIVAYLRRTGRASLLRGVAAGVGLSFVLAGAGAYAWWQAYQRGDFFNQGLWEGVMMLIAAVLVGTLLWQVQRMARRLKGMKGEIEAKIDAAAGSAGAAGSAKSSWTALVGVALVTIIFVARELVEALFMVGGWAMGGEASRVIAGAAIGLGLAGAYAYLWSRFGNRLAVGTILRATTIFLVLFLIQLVVSGVHELSEGGVLPNSEAIHLATERFGPEGDVGIFYGYVVAAIPMVVLAYSLLRAFFGHGSGRGNPVSTTTARAIAPSPAREP